MKAATIVFIILVSAAGLAILIAALRQKKPLRSLIVSALGGLALLFLISFTGKITGFYLALNPWTVACAAAVGIPGVMMMLLLKFIWDI